MKCHPNCISWNAFLKKTNFHSVSLPLEYLSNFINSYFWSKQTWLKKLIILANISTHFFPLKVLSIHLSKLSAHSQYWHKFFRVAHVNWTNGKPFHELILTCYLFNLQRFFKYKNKLLKCMVLMLKSNM